MGVPAVKKKHMNASYIFMRGFGPKGLVLRPDFKIVAGRAFQPGKRELIAGTGAQSQFAGMNIGDQVILPDGPWTIVGAFTSNRDILEGEIIGDADTIMSATHHKDYNSVIVRLASLDSLATFKKALTSNPALAVTVERQTDWYHNLNDQFYTVFSEIAYAVGFILALGALFCALNTMYAAISSRMREIATLRALGYGAFAVALSVLAESILLCVLGALVGAAIAWAINDGRQESLGINVFYLSVSPAMVGVGIVWAVVVALLGAFCHPFGPRGVRWWKHCGRHSSVVLGGRTWVSKTTNLRCWIRSGRAQRACAPRKRPIALALCGRCRSSDRRRRGRAGISGPTTACRSMR